MTETRAHLYTSSGQAPYRSFRRKRQNSFILLPLLSPKSFATLRGPHEVIAFCRKPIAWSLMISAKVPCFNHPEEATLPLRWLCQLPYAQARGAPRPRLPVAAGRSGAAQRAHHPSGQPQQGGTHLPLRHGIHLRRLPLADGRK